MAKAARRHGEQTGSPIRRHHERATLIGLGLNKIGRAAAGGHPGGARHDRQGAASRPRRRPEVRGMTRKQPVSVDRQEQGRNDEAQRYPRQCGRARSACASAAASARARARPRAAASRARTRAPASHQRLRRRPDAAAHAHAEARLQQHLPEEFAEVNLGRSSRRSRPGSSTPRTDQRRGAGARPASCAVPKDGVRLLGKASSRPSSTYRGGRRLEPRRRRSRRPAAR